MSVDGIIAVDLELSILPSCGLLFLLFFGWSPLLFEWSSSVCWNNLLNLFLCLSMILSSLDSLTLLMKSLHSLYYSSSITSLRSLIPVSLCLVQMSMVLLIDLTLVHQLFLSFLNNFSSPGCSYTALKVNTHRGDVLT